MSARRVALRLAWRTCRRAPGRTVLITALIGLPIAAAVLIDLGARTAAPPPETRATQILGTADAALLVSDQRHADAANALDNAANMGSGDLLQYASAEGRAPARDPRSVDLSGLLPARTRLTPIRNGLAVGVRARDRYVSADARGLIGTSLTSGMTAARTGRLPVSAGEVAVSSTLAERLDLDPSQIGLGARPTIQLEAPTKHARLTVTGIVDDPRHLSGLSVWTTPERFDALSTGGPTFVPRATGYLADLPPMSVERLHALLERLERSGVVLFPRDVFLHPEAWTGAGSSVDPGTFALIALVVTFGVLEIVLLAGTAFAVGAKRQTRELGMVAAIGGSARDVRRIVLAQGVTLGTLGASSAIVVGVGVPIAAKPLTERVLDQQIPAWGLAPLDYLGLALVGLIAGVAAAVVPAISAGRVPAVVALSGRFAESRTARISRVGTILVAAGVMAGAIGVIGLQRFYGGLAAIARQERALGYSQSHPAPTAMLAVGLTGLVLLAIGLTWSMPTWVLLMARTARRLPLTFRFAFQDAGRHRHRTGPAAAAVMLAVAGSVGLAYLFTGNEDHDRARYIPEVPVGAALVGPSYDGPAAPPDLGSDPSQSVARWVDRVESAVRPILHDARIYPRTIPYLSPDAIPRVTTTTADPLDLTLSVSSRSESSTQRSSQIGIVEPSLLRALDSTAAAGAIRALENGDAVVLNAQFQSPNGIVPIELDAGEPTVVARPSGYLFRPKTRYGTTIPNVLISPETAHRLGFVGRDIEAVIVPASTTTQSERDQLAAALDSTDFEMRWELGFEGNNGLIDLVFGGIAAVVTLAGVAISVALSTVESRPDLATLGAIGAPPGRRRRLTAAQALLVGGIGGIGGIVLGSLMGVLLRTSTGSPGWAVPWGALGIVGLAIPVFAALCAALFTPSRLPMVRQIA